MKPIKRTPLAEQITDYINDISRPLSFLTFQDGPFIIVQVPNTSHHGQVLVIDYHLRNIYSRSVELMESEGYKVCKCRHFNPAREHIKRYFFGTKYDKNLAYKPIDKLNKVYLSRVAL